MTENQERLRESRDKPSKRPAPLFAEFSRVRQVVTVIGAPLVFGVVAVFTLTWWAPGWWGWQGIGVLGAVVGGYEHLRLWPAALRGVAGGLIASMAVVGLRGFLAGEEVTDFDPVSFPIYAVIVSAIVHAGGAGLRRLTR